MNAIQTLLTDHIDIWTAADTEKKTGRGRSSGNAASVYGIRKLRELILELAVRGKLVPQDANDEPASALLKRIQADIKTVPVEQHPFVLPQGWEWIRFGDALDFQGGGQPPKHAFSDTKLVGYVQLIQIRDLGERPQPVFIKKELAAKFCTSEDIMIGRYGASVGKVFWGKDGAYNVALVKIIDEFGIYYNRFLYEFFRCPYGQSFFSGISRSAQAGFNKSDIAGQLVPVCSLAEQRRIVAKVDELMALCDQLETRHNIAAAAHEKLVSHLLGTLTQSPVRPELVEGCGSTGSPRTEFEENWQRIAVHFDTLFTTEASIDVLKQTLLQLAVMGKLVPQDPNDEPVSTLFKRIQTEKAKLIAEGKLKKDKPLPPITDEEIPFDLPQSWAWVRLGEVLNKITDGTHHSPTNTPTGDFKYISAKNIKPWGLDLCDVTYVTTEVHQEIYSRCDPEFGDVLYIKDGATTGIGTINPLTEPFSMLSSVALLKPSLGIKNTYLLNTMVAPLFYDEMRAGMTGVAITRVTLSKLNDAIIPLPPLAEQHRIVAKVDELMALCDQLKTRLAAANQLQQKLADVVVEQAVA